MSARIQFLIVGLVAIIGLAIFCAFPEDLGAPEVEVKEVNNWQPWPTYPGWWVWQDDEQNMTPVLAYIHRGKMEIAFIEETEECAYRPSVPELERRNDIGLLPGKFAPMHFLF